MLLLMLFVLLLMLLYVQRYVVGVFVLVMILFQITFFSFYVCMFFGLLRVVNFAVVITGTLLTVIATSTLGQKHILQ